MLYIFTSRIQLLVYSWLLSQDRGWTVVLKVIRTIQQFLVVKDTNNSIVCVDPPSPLNVTLSARICCERRRTCSYRSIPPAGMALSSKPAALRCCCRSTGQTDGQTVARPLHGQDPAPRTVRSLALSVTFLFEFAYCTLFIVCFRLFLYMFCACVYLPC